MEVTTDTPNSILSGGMGNMYMITHGLSMAGPTGLPEKRRRMNEYSTGIFWEAMKMTVERFTEIMLCNEPEFDYNEQTYSICSPDGKYYVTASDSPADMYLEFDTLDDLLDRWMIQGRPLRSILPDIDLEE